MDPLQSGDIDSRHGEELAEVTNGIVGLFAEYYGRGPTRAKSFLLDDTYVVTVLRDDDDRRAHARRRRHGDQVRSVRLTFQEAMADVQGRRRARFGRRVASYHSQLLIDSDIGFELFVFED